MIFLQFDLFIKTLDAFHKLDDSCKYLAEKNIYISPKYWNNSKEIHKGNSENNLTYILGEYISNSDIYKVLVLIHNQDDIQKIIKIKIDIEK